MIKPTDECVAVLSNKEISENVMEMTFRSQHIAENAKPGQFVNMAVSTDKLRRPFTISGVDSKTGAVTIRYKIVGVGTDILANKEPGESIYCMGPLGSGFEIETGETNKHQIFIGGGMGAAFIPFAEKALDSYTPFHTIIGGRTRIDVEFWEELTKLGVNIMTEDGSFGDRGLVTDKLKELICLGEKIGKIFACGPVGMMKAVYDIAKEFNVPCEFALEAEMGCGYGVCKSCTCMGSDGQPVSICKDGPVLAGDAIDWAYLKDKEDFKKRIEVKSPSEESEEKPAANFLNDFLPNPYVAASGCVGFGLEQEGLTDMTKFGAIMTKGITMNPRPGNRGTRIKELPGGGTMNSIGLENPGVKRFLAEIDRNVRAKYWNKDTKIIANISAFGVEEFSEMIEMLGQSESIHAYEINVSCPNLGKDKKIIGTDAQMVFDVVKNSVNATSLPIIVKLTPNVTNIAEVALAAQEAGAQAISLINTVVGYDINPYTGRGTFFNGDAGISDHEIVRNIALSRTVSVAKSTTLPIIAGGGIKTDKDIVMFALAGADAFAIGTELLRNPGIIEALPSAVEGFLKEHWGTSDIKDITGRLFLDNEGRTIAQARAALQR
ncbi:MAG: FAD-binding oxidoreductase [Alphaproteobacteria bacterium]|nr:FAD-binding oxidoreductase [Alphaproteobacteria bacterium]